MSFDALLMHTVTIYNPAETGNTDRYGNEEVADDEGVEYPARVMPTGTGETDDLSRDTRTTSFQVFLPKTAAVDSLSLVDWEGYRYKVQGEPRMINGHSSLHHIELFMERAEG